MVDVALRITMGGKTLRHQMADSQLLVNQSDDDVCWQVQLAAPPSSVDGQLQRRMVPSGRSP